MALRLRTSLLAVLVTTSLPLAGTLLASLYFWSQSEKSAAQERDARQAVEVTQSLRFRIDEARRVLESVARSPIDWTSTKAMDQRVTSYSDLFPYSSGVSVIGLQGFALSPQISRARGLDLHDRQWFRQALATKSFVIGEFLISRVTHIPVLPLSLPVLNGTEVRAVVATSIDLSWVYDEAQSRGLPPGSTINLVSPDGTVLVRFPEPQKYVGGSFDEAPLVKAAAQPRETAAAMELPGLDGERRLYVLQPLTVQGMFWGTVAVGIPLLQVHRSSSTAFTVTWALIAFVILLGAAAAVIGIRSLVLRPIAIMADHAKLLASGDFSARVPVTGLPLELGVLAGAVNHTAQALEARDSELTRYHEHLEELVEERTRDLTKSQTELERSNAELQQFAYVASHDLQEPLRMVASFTQLLGQKYSNALDDQAQQYIAFAVDGATRMQQLINDLLAFSRIDTQAKELGPVDSADCLSLAMANLDLRLRETGTEIVRDGLPIVLGDRQQLSQVFQNLVANAVKFNRSKPPRVWVSARVEDGVARFSVDDNGIGISPEFAERVFVIFQRLNPRSDFPGTGIGLALVKRIVERHGGKVWFEPSDKGGTRFVFTLPVPQGDQRA